MGFERHLVTILNWSRTGSGHANRNYSPERLPSQGAEQEGEKIGNAHCGVARRFSEEGLLPNVSPNAAHYALGGGNRPE